MHHNVIKKVLNRRTNTIGTTMPDTNLLSSLYPSGGVRFSAYCSNGVLRWTSRLLEAASPAGTVSADDEEEEEDVVDCR